MLSFYSDFMGEQALQHLVPILGAGYEVVPEVSLLGEDTFKTNRYAQAHNLEVLPLKAVFRTARAVNWKSPTNKFRKYARQVDGHLTQDVINEAYGRLHTQMYEQQYLIRAKEVLIWSTPNSHPRIVGGKWTAQLKSYLIRDYNVPAEKDVFDISGIENPIMEIEWPVHRRPITKPLIELFDADPRTYISTDTNPFLREGFEALGAGFGGRAGPDLDSGWDPWGRNSVVGSLLGRKIQKK